MHNKQDVKNLKTATSLIFPFKYVLFCRKRGKKKKKKEGGGGKREFMVPVLIINIAYFAQMKKY